MLATLSENNAPVCYGSFGCFNKSELSKEWIVPNIIAQYPERSEKQNVHFFIFSCKDRYNPSILAYNVSEDKMKNLNYDPQNRTIFMVHGYTDFYNQFNWMGDLKDHILKLKPCRHNVVIVDWSGGSKTTNYLQAVANTQLVGAIIASFINKLNKVYRTTNDHFTLIGHSLGAQIVGFAGKRLKKPRKTRLIIGLDPAGPAFSDVSLQNRLNPDDAQLVITLQTNGGVNVADGLGLLKPVGHYNFFPNGGETQPGCEPVHGITGVLVNGLAEGLSDAVACSHRRAFLLIAYEESKFDDFQSIAYRCSNYSDFSAGKCGTCRNGTDDCKPWGRWFDYWQEQKPSSNWQAPIIYYVDTRARLPYSYFKYQVIVKTGDGFKPFSGKLSLNVSGSLRKDFVENININDKFEPNKEYTYLHKSIKSLGRIEIINATLVDNLSRSNVKNLIDSIVPGNKKSNDQLIIKEMQINYMNGYAESKRRSLSTQFKRNNSNMVVKSQKFSTFIMTKLSNDNNYDVKNKLNI